MKKSNAKLKVNLTVIASLLLSSSLAFASTENETSNESSMLNTLSADPFFTDSKIKITFRNMWKYLKTEDGPTNYKTVAQAWGQAIAVDYQSGYFKDFIGVDVSYYGGAKLAASDNFASRAILYNNNGHAEGYSKIGQRYVKLKLDLDDIRFDAKAGWQVMKNIGMLTSSTRMSINSYQGWYGKVTKDNFFAEVAYVSGTSRRDSPNKVRFTGYNNIDHIWTGGLTYKTKDMSLVYFYGDAKDFVQQHGLETSFKVMPKLTLGSQIYLQKADDKDKMKQWGKRAFDEKAWHYAIDAKWKEQDWALTVGASYTNADKENGLGYYSKGIVGNSRGRFNSVAYADIDYTRDGEFYLFADYGYNLTPDYTLGVRTMYGQLRYKGNNINSNTITLYNVWNPKAIKNLSVYADAGYGWHYKNNNRTPILDQNGKFQRAHSLSGSMTLAYSFNL